MILKVFSIYDGAAKSFNKPFFMLTKAEAMRAFVSTIRTESLLHENPTDFSLYQLGTYDDSDGKFSEDISNLGSALYFMNAEEKKLKAAKVVNMEKENALSHEA